MKDKANWFALQHHIITVSVLTVSGLVVGLQCMFAVVGHSLNISGIDPLEVMYCSYIQCFYEPVCGTLQHVPGCVCSKQHVATMLLLMYHNMRISSS